MFALHMVHGMFPEMFKEDVSIVIGLILFAVVLNSFIFLLIVDYVLHHHWTYHTLFVIFVVHLHMKYTITT